MPSPFSEMKCPQCGGRFRCDSSERSYDGQVRRQRRKCYDCGHRGTEYAVTQQFFDELIAAREIVTKLASHYWELTE
jgi:transcriptional regulator NrdR family protein